MVQISEENRLKTPLENVYLLKDFCTQQEEAYLLSKIEELGGIDISEGDESQVRQYKDKGTAAGWREVNGRRSMYWGGQLLPRSHTLVPRPLPAFMDKEYPRIVQRTVETGAFELACGDKFPNHVLVNEYLPGQGIMPHEDGEAYMPTVATLSLGSHCILDMYSQERVLLCSVYVPARSLIVLSGPMYTHALHGIDSRAADDAEALARCVNAPGGATQTRSRRVSITMRRVEKERRLL